MSWLRREKSSRENSTPKCSATCPVLRRKWTAALVPGRGPFPSYAEVMLGSLGRLSDQIMLFINCAEEGAFTIVRAGRRILDWVGAAEPGTGRGPRIWPRTGRVRSMKAMSARTARQATGDVSLCASCAGTGSSRATRCSRCRCIRAGAAGWSGPTSRARHQYNLVETIFPATEQGCGACGHPRRAGRPSDFQRPRESRRGATAEPASDGAVVGGWCRLQPARPAGVIRRLRDTLAPATAARSKSIATIVVSDSGSPRSANAVGHAHRHRGAQAQRGFVPPAVRQQPDADVGVRPGNDAVPRRRRWAVQHYGYTRERFRRCSSPTSGRSTNTRCIVTSSAPIGESYEPNRTWRHVKADGSRDRCAHLCAAADL